MHLIVSRGRIMKRIYQLLATEASIHISRDNDSLSVPRSFDHNYAHITRYIINLSLSPRITYTLSTAEVQHDLLTHGVSPFNLVALL